MSVGSQKACGLALAGLGMVAVVALFATLAPRSAGASELHGDVEAGRKAFLLCSACHTVEPGGAALIGPNLHGVVGRDIASVEGFEYSPGLAALEGSWDAARLHEFLRSPMTYVPGTKMGMGGIGDAQERADLIAFLEGLADAGAGPASSAPAPDFGPDWPAGPGQAEAGQLCNACHSLAIVKQQGLSRDSWDELLDWMVEEQGMAAQSPEQRALILDYLATHFGIPE